MIVEFPSGAQRVRGALFLPDGAARAGVIVVGSAKKLSRALARARW